MVNTFPQSALLQTNLRKKIEIIDSELHYLLNDHADRLLCDFQPARPHQSLPRDAKSTPLGLQSIERQARLLHDVANIELQAMELGLRTLYEFPNAPTEYRRGLAKIVKEEAEHFELCLNFIEKNKFRFGDWPFHFKLWDSTSTQDDLVDRLFIVHCYLEASGLDASEVFLQKLAGVHSFEIKKIIQRISRDEVSHVEFGLKWYRQLIADYGVSDNGDLGHRAKRLADRLPSRHSPISHSLRLQAGFNHSEILEMEKFREKRTTHIE